MPQDTSEAPLNRRDRRRLEIYERIVEAGEALFEEQGYDELPFILRLSEQRLVDMCAHVAMRPGHRMKLLAMLPAYRPA